MQRHLILVLVASSAFAVQAICFSDFAGAADGKEGKATEPPVDKYHVEQLEGWTCHVSPKLYAPEHEALRQQTLRLVSNQLFSVKQLLAEDRVAELLKVPLWVDLDSSLRSLQYHPSRDWLVEHGHHGEMAKAVHLPDAKYFVSARHTNEQPWAVLHELAHAYHDRVLGFDHGEIEQAHARVKKDGLYDNVLHVVGDQRKHYALTNPKEFFAEMTECYLGTNDFYPFVRGELKRHDAATFDLMAKIWGEVPSEKKAATEKK
jgi:hypothetical protein